MRGAVAYLLLVVAFVGAVVVLRQYDNNQLRTYSRQTANENRTALVERCQATNANLRAPVNGLFRAQHDSWIQAADTWQTLSHTFITAKSREAAAILAALYRRNAAALKPVPIPDCEKTIPPIR